MKWILRMTSKIKLIHIIGNLLDCGGMIILGREGTL